MNPDRFVVVPNGRAVHDRWTLKMAPFSDRGLSQAAADALNSGELRTSDLVWS